VTPFDPKWQCELPDATKSLELRSVILQHRDEVEYMRYMYYATKSFSQFLSHFIFIHFFKMSNSVVECFLQSLPYSMCGDVS
jgi:hypothetical protein